MQEQWTVGIKDNHRSNAQTTPCDSCDGVSAAPLLALLELIYVTSVVRIRMGLHCGASVLFE